LILNYAHIVKIFLAPGFRSGEEMKEAYRQIGRVATECHTSVGASVGKSCHNEFGCDIMYGVYLGDDSRAFDISKGVNRLEVACCKVVKVNSRTLEPV